MGLPPASLFLPELPGFHNPALLQGDLGAKANGCTCRVQEQKGRLSIPTVRAKDAVGLRLKVASAGGFSAQPNAIPQDTMRSLASGTCPAAVGKQPGTVNFFLLFITQQALILC